MITGGSWKPMAVLSLVTALALAGCAVKPSYEASLIMDADRGSVRDCEFVVSVSGSSGVGNMMASTGIENAKVEAREQAADSGATHIVWTSVQGGYAPNVAGSAYNCD